MKEKIIDPAIRNIVVGEITIPLSQFHQTVKDALVTTMGLLRMIEIRTRFKSDSICSPGFQKAVKELASESSRFISDELTKLVIAHDAWIYESVVRRGVAALFEGRLQ
jgi:hypothetical protein